MQSLRVLGNCGLLLVLRDQEEVFRADIALEDDGTVAGALARLRQVLSAEGALRNLIHDACE